MEVFLARCSDFIFSVAFPVTLLPQPTIAKANVTPAFTTGNDFSLSQVWTDPLRSSLQSCLAALGGFHGQGPRAQHTGLWCHSGVTLALPGRQKSRQQQERQFGSVRTLPAQTHPEVPGP